MIDAWVFSESVVPHSLVRAGVEITRSFRLIGHSGSVTNGDSGTGRRAGVGGSSRPDVPAVIAPTAR
jgi:hypothetical protein